MKPNWLAASALALATAALVASAQDDPFAVARERCRLGDTLSQCRTNISIPELTATELGELLSQKPLAKRLSFLAPFLKEKRLVAWKLYEAHVVAEPLHVFAIFSPDGHLIDLLGARDGFPWPLVDGVYSKRVKGLKEGMTVRQLFDLVGEREPTRIERAPGKWTKGYSLEVYPGRTYVIEADPETGIIVRVGDWTI